MRGAKNDVLYIVGNNLRKRREELGMSMAELATKLTMSVPAVSKIETGVTNINLSRLQDFAEVLEIDPGYFFYKEDSEILSAITPHIQGIAEDIKRCERLVNDLLHRYIIISGKLGEIKTHIGQSK